MQEQCSGGFMHNERYAHDGPNYRVGLSCLKRVDVRMHVQPHTPTVWTIDDYVIYEAAGMVYTRYDGNTCHMAFGHGEWN